MENKKITVLAEHGQEVLIRIEGKENIGGMAYRTVRHEWWFDRDMMEKGIRSDEDGRIFYRGFAGTPEEQVLETFRNEGFR